MADPATPDVTGASSTPNAESITPAPVQTGDVLERMTPEQRTDWKLTGKLPASESLASSAEAPAAQPVDQAASTDASEPKAASEPAKPTKNADTRKAQLQAEIKAELARREQIRLEIAREEGRLAALRGSDPDAKSAKSSPAAEEPVAVTRPKPSEDEIGSKYDSYAAFVEDLTEWKVEQREFQSQHKSQRAEQETQLKARVEKFREAVAADPEFVTKVHDRVKALVPSSMLPKGQPVNGQSELAERFLKSDVGVPLMRHFSDHPEDLDRIAGLHPDDFYIELGKLEAKLSGGVPVPVPATPTKHVSSAPTPPTTLGNRPADAGDPMKAALARGDFAAYRDLKNKAEIAARR